MKRTGFTLRSADRSHAKRLHRLIAANLEEGHLLPRTLAEITVHAERFVIVLRGRTLVGCAELAPLSAQVAEVRSLVVAGSARGAGVGTLLVNELSRRARRHGFDKLSAFTHAPRYFIGLGFSIVPHLWLHEKMSVDCVTCPQFRRCGQYAMVLSLDEARDALHEREQTLIPVVRYA